MTDSVYLNADRTEVVDSYSPGKKWQVSRKEAKRLGLLKDEAKPVQARRSEPAAEPAQRRRTTKKK